MLHRKFKGHNIDGGLYVKTYIHWTFPVAFVLKTTQHFGR